MLARLVEDVVVFFEIEDGTDAAVAAAYDSSSDLRALDNVILPSNTVEAAMLESWTQLCSNHSLCFPLCQIASVTCCPMVSGKYDAVAAA